MHRLASAPSREASRLPSLTVLPLLTPPSPHTPAHDEPPAEQDRVLERPRHGQGQEPQDVHARRSCSGRSGSPSSPGRVKRALTIGRLQHTKEGDLWTIIDTAVYVSSPQDATIGPVLTRSCAPGVRPRVAVAVRRLAELELTHVCAAA